MGKSSEEITSDVPEMYIVDSLLIAMNFSLTVFSNLSGVESGQIICEDISLYFYSGFISTKVYQKSLILLCLKMYFGSSMAIASKIRLHVYADDTLLLDQMQDTMVC